jgi:hypothetical protein
MSYLSSQSYSGVLIPNQIFKGQIYKIPTGYLSVVVSVKLQEEGFLSIYSSNDGINFTPFDQTTINGPFKSVVYPLRGQYFYLQYENFVVEDNIQLLCRIAEVLPEGLIDSVSVSVSNQPPFLFDGSGNLLVSGSGGGGTTSDVYITNESLNVVEVNSQDILTSLQSFTDNISFNTNSALWVAVNDVLNPVQIENKTGNKLDVYDASNNVILDQFKFNGEQLKVDVSGQSLSVNTISGFSLETTQQELLNTVSNPPSATLFLDSPEGISAYADSNPAPIVDLYKRKGWYYTNTSASNKFNYYFYSNGNTTQTLADITGAWCVCENDSTTTTSSIVNPIISIYTVGNLNIWYQSSRAYTSNINMVAGMKYLFYWGVEPSVYPELPRVQLSLATQNGTLQPTEQILTMSVGSDSGATPGFVKNLMTHIGWRNSSNEFITELIGDADYISTDVRILDKLSSGLDISGSVSVSNFPATQAVSIATLPSVEVSNFPATQPISGSVSVSNFPATQAVSIATLPSVEINNFPASQTVSGSVSVSNFPATQAVSIATLPSVEINNFPATQPISGSVSVSNQISGFATETTLGQIDMTLSSGSLITQSIVENKANNNLRVDLYGDNGTTQEKLTCVSGKLQVDNIDAKISEITSALTTTNTYLDRNNYDASGNLKTFIENTLDCHIYGSSDGSTWHHIKTNANGVIHTHLETVGSGALSATVSSNNYNALDVSVKNSSLPVNSTNSGSWGNASNNSSLNGYQYTSGIDISASAYIYVIYRDGSTGVFDSILVEWSFDNTDWYYLGDSIAPSAPMGQSYRQGTLNDKRKYGWNYMRFKNNGNSSLSSVYITILGSSI